MVLPEGLLMNIWVENLEFRPTVKEMSLKEVSIFSPGGWPFFAILKLFRQYCRQANENYLGEMFLNCGTSV